MIAGHTNLLSEGGLERFRARLKFAAALGLPIVNTGITAIGFVKEESKEVLAKGIAILRRAVRMAEDFGVLIGLENHPLTGTGLILRNIVKEVNHPKLRINYDTANVIYYDGVRPEDDIKHSIDYLVHVHLKDKSSMEKHKWDFPALGEGIVDFGVILKVLNGSGFSGPLSLEPELDGHPPTAELVDKVLLKSRLHLEAILNTLK